MNLIRTRHVLVTMRLRKDLNNEKDAFLAAMRRVWR
jgi:hypothetical protein